MLWGIIAAAVIAWNFASQHGGPKDKTLVDHDAAAAQTVPASTGPLRPAKINASLIFGAVSRDIAGVQFLDRPGRRGKRRAGMDGMSAVPSAGDNPGDK
jgi:hypothetical protein